MPFVRMARIALRARRAPRLAAGDESVVSFRVWPNDLDVNFHLNNGRYLTIMDLGRFDLVARNGLLRVVLARRLMPLVGSAVMHYFRPLAPFARYELRTRMVGWDEKWFYVAHRFERSGELAAAGAVRGLFRGRDGNVRPADALEQGGLPSVSPPLPEWMHRWVEADGMWVAALKTEGGDEQSAIINPQSSIRNPER